MRYVLVLLLVLPAVLGLEITEVHPNPADGGEWVEIKTDGFTGTLVISDNYAQNSIEVDLPEGYVIIAESSMNVECPVVVLGGRIGNGLANGGDSVQVILGNASDSFSYASSSSGKSETPDGRQEPSPCYERTQDVPDEGSDGQEPEEPELCGPPVISADLIQEDVITYRIVSDEAYEYWVEDAHGEVVRERSSSSSTSTKRYTPEPTERDHAFLIKATSTCGDDALVVGFVSDASSTCEMEEDEILEAITEELATHICRPHIEQAAMLEMQLEACEEPEPAMTSFYTLAGTAAQEYAYRSKAKSNATFLACAASHVSVDGDAIEAMLADEDIVNATPVLLALENGSVIDVRLGEAPDFAGTWAQPVPEPSDLPQAEPDDGSEADIPKPASPLERRIWGALNRWRTSRTGQQVKPWIVPLGFGLAGLVVALPRT